MDLCVMAADAERQAVGPAACKRDVSGRRRARRLRYDDRLTGDATLSWAELDLYFTVSRDGTYSRTKHALQRLGWRFAAFDRGVGHGQRFWIVWVA
jgi:hypothetical protein